MTIKVREEDMNLDRAFDLINDQQYPPPPPWKGPQGWVDRYQCLLCDLKYLAPDRVECPCCTRFHREITNFSNTVVNINSHAINS